MAGQQEETALIPLEGGAESEELEKMLQSLSNEDLFYELGRVRKLYSGLITRLRYVLGHTCLGDVPPEQLLEHSDAAEKKERQLFCYYGALLKETGKRLLGTGRESDITAILDAVQEEICY
ncbi:MAG TPA: hypothetical protein VJC21_06230 [Candidatus Nanoarchaeia archaeon]|nr:hypothetical protein [Candidatus Nanoarchaeia archaeon]